MLDERRAALEEIASEVRVCTRCRLAETRTRAVPGEGDPDTEVVFVGEGPGFNEDREGRPFIGRAGAFLGTLLGSVGWQREDVFITNVVKCRPPDNRDPLPDEIVACAPHLERQLAVLDPAVVVTLGRFSMNTFIPGARIGQVHGTVHPVDPATGAASALAFAMYHPAAALRSTGVQRESLEDMKTVPGVLLRARAMREQAQAQAGAGEEPAGAGEEPAPAATSRVAPNEPGGPPQPTMGPTTPAQTGDAVTATSDRADATHALATEHPVDDASQLTLF
jgi:uracil-DNA glycosylase